MTNAEIKAREYGTMPCNGRVELCRRLLKEGFELSGVPGFYPCGSEWTLAGAPGLLIPVRDHEEHISGLQIRVDAPRDGARYLWLSSAGRPEGTGSGAPAHVAYPTGIWRDSGGGIWLTEAPLKADIAAQLLNAVVIGAVGVALWKAGLDMALKLTDGKPETLVVAYDMDAETNPHVARYRSDLIVTAFKSRWRVRVALWNPHYKGIDDALVAGTTISYVNPFRSARVDLPRFPVYEGEMNE